MFKICLIVIFYLIEINLLASTFLVAEDFQIPILVNIFLKADLNGKSSNAYCAIVFEFDKQNDAKILIEQLIEKDEISKDIILEYTKYVLHISLKGISIINNQLDETHALYKDFSKKSFSFNLNKFHFWKGKENWLNLVLEINLEPNKYAKNAHITFAKIFINEDEYKEKKSMLNAFLRKLNTDESLFKNLQTLLIPDAIKIGGLDGEFVQWKQDKSISSINEGLFVLESNLWHMSVHRAFNF